MKRLLLKGLVVGFSMILLYGCGQGSTKPAADEGSTTSVTVGENATSDATGENATSDTIGENATSDQSGESTTSDQSAEVSSSALNGEITKENLPVVSEALKAAGLSRVDVFEDWVTAFENGIPEDTETSGFADPDCRMTVMLLAGDSIKYKDVEKEYKGTYLMFDMDAIENQEEYSVLKDQANLFTTMFGEQPVPKSGLSEALPDRWKRYGITFDNDKASIISIVFQTMEGNEAYVGHTGILVPYDGEYLFIEKIAFSEPYRVTKVKDAKALIDIFSARPDYTVEADEPTPQVFENDILIGELSRQES